jgi:hypothetical protein
MSTAPAARFTRTATIAAAVACTGFLAGAIPANAATYCVQKPSCVGTDKSELQAALDAAKLAPGPDRIEIGQGTFSSPDPYEYSAVGANTVDVIGVGPAGTRLVNTASGSITTLSLLRGSVSDLEVVGPAGFDIAATPIALTLTGTAQRVKVTGGFSGVHLESGASLRDSVVTGSGLDFSRPAVLFAGSTGAVLDSTVNGNSDGIVGSHTGQFTVSRSTVSASIGVSATDGAEIDVDDSLVRSSYAGLYAHSTSKPATIVAKNVTIVGPGSGSGAGVEASSSGAGQTATVVLQNSVVSDVQQSLRRKTSAGSAFISVSHDDYDPSTVSDSGTGKVTDLGGNTDAAPGFVDASGGDFRPAPGSALIDAGGESPQVSTNDRDGGPRSVDGNGDGTALPDIGAYEFVPAPPADPPSEPAPPSGGDDPGTPSPPVVAATPRLSAVSFSPRRFRAVTVAAPRSARQRRRGSKLRFRLSKDAIVRVTVKRVRRGRAARSAGTLMISGRQGANSREFKGRVAKRVLAPGKYVALVTATDADGHRSARRRVRFTILAR